MQTYESGLIKRTFYFLNISSAISLLIGGCQPLGSEDDSPTVDSSVAERKFEQAASLDSISQSPLAEDPSVRPPVWGQTDFSRKAYLKWVSDNNEREFTNIVLHRMRACRVEDDPRCQVEFFLRSVSSKVDSSTGTAVCNTSDPQCIELLKKSAPKLNSGQWVELTAKPYQNSQGANLTSFSPGQCELIVEVAAQVSPVATPTESCNSALTWKAIGTVKQQRNVEYSGALPSNLTISSTCQGDPSQPGSTPTRTSDDVQTCLCPSTGSGYTPECGNDFFNLYAAFFNDQSTYRFTLKCNGGATYGQAEFAIADLTTCATTGSSTNALRQIHADINGDGYYSSSATLSSTGGCSSDYVGSFCPQTATVWGVQTGANSMIGFSGVSTSEYSASEEGATAASELQNTPEWTFTTGKQGHASNARKSDRWLKDIRRLIDDTFLYTDDDGLMVSPTPTPTPAPAYSTSLAWLNGVKSGDGEGHAMLGGFHIDNDAYTEVASGAPFFDWSVYTDGGGVTIIPGGPNRFAGAMPFGNAGLGRAFDGLATRRALKLYGGGSCRHAGSALASARFDLAGTENDYGLLMIGQRDQQGGTAQECGFPTVSPRPGSVFLIFGGQSYTFPLGELPLEVCELRKAGLNAVELRSNTVGDLFGASMSSDVDVDGDGMPELLVGAPGEGKAYLFSGTRLNSLKASAGTLCANGTTGVANIADLQPDVFAPMDLGNGAKSNTLGEQVLLVRSLFADSTTNASLAGIVLGAPVANNGTAETGAVLLWKPKGAATSYGNPTVLWGAHNSALNPMVLRSLPDLNDDGLSELVVGARNQNVPDANGSTLQHGGAVFVLLNRSSLVLNPFLDNVSLAENGLRVLPGFHANSYFGDAVDTTSVEDKEAWLLIGQPEAEEGKTWLYSYSMSASAATLTGGKGPASEKFWALTVSGAWGLGQDVAFVGDVDLRTDGAGVRAPEIWIGADGSYATDLANFGAEPIFMFWGDTDY